MNPNNPEGGLMGKESISPAGIRKTMTRREFHSTVLSASLGMTLSCGKRTTETVEYVRTVRGPVPLEQLGFTLPHEHVIVDWNGKDGKSRERYNPDEAFRIMLPYMEDIRALGVRTFVDCTWPWGGRDALLLRRLSESTEMHIVMPTGLYEKTFAPPFAFEASMEEIADFFIRELEEGIEDTGILPGFIKIASSNEGPMTQNDEKIVTASCRAHKQTGATINSHTFQGASALRQLDILDREGVDPHAFTYVHAGYEENIELNIEAASRGCWIEYDSIRPQTAEKHAARILTMIDRGFKNQLMLSQDSGWYTVGEPNGGRIRPYIYLPEEFLPLIESKGVTPDLIHLITVINPGRSYKYG